MFRALLVVLLTLSSSVGCKTDKRKDAQETPRYLAEIHQLTGQNAFARNVYSCMRCSLEAFQAIKLPEGWEKPALKRFVSSYQEMRDFPHVPGAPRDIDLIPSVYGAEHHLVAHFVDGEMVDLLNGISRAHVLRVSRLKFKAGSQVHELFDERGARYILYAVGLDFDYEHELPKVPLPKGWSYKKRTLEEDLAVDAKGETSLISFRQNATWQRY